VSGLRCDNDDECTPPFTFVGMDPERGGKGSVERFVDGRHAVRHRGDLAADRDEQGLPLGYMTDCNRCWLTGMSGWIAATFTGSGSGDRP
jgi:hypothetical protein